VIGEEAHIISEAPTGPRHADLPDYDVYDNLILLCGNDHKPADDQWRHYTAEKLRQIKSEHEAWVARRLASVAETDPIRLVPDPAFPIPKVMSLCMTGTQLWRVMEGARAFYRYVPDGLTEEQHDLIADFSQSVRDWLDAASFEDSFRLGRDAAKHLSEEIKGLNEAGLFVGALRRHCLLTGGKGDPSPWIVFDLQFEPILEAMLVDENGQPLVDDQGLRIWPPAS
jgi:hypothetical protein